MRAALRRFPLERAVQAAIVATIVSAVLAAGALLSWLDEARKLRWAALVVLLALALVYAARHRRGPKPLAAYVVAGVLLALALISTLWSVAPASTAARALSLAILLATCGALSFAAAGRPEAVQRLLDAVLAATGVVAVGGLLVLLFRHDRALAPATTALPTRYQGLGGGPDTATMVLAVGVPLALHALADGRALARRALGGALLALLAGSIVASGSRGALAAAAAGALAYVLVRAVEVRRRLLGAAVVAAAAAVAVLITRIPQPLSESEANPPTAAVAPDPSPFAITPRPPYRDASLLLRLQDEIGHPGFGVGDTTPRPRTLFGTSGRAEAWTGALEHARERPLLGYGFGTEARVFVDRWVHFNSGTVENSYLGFLLQLGLAGLGAFLAFVAVVAVATRRCLRALREHGRLLVAAAAGAGVAALTLAFFQSYVYSVGNNATAAAWICGFLLAAAATARDGAPGRA